MTASRPGFYLGTSIDGVHLNAEQLNVRAINLNDLIGTMTYTDALFHILLGRKPDDRERKMFDMVLVAFHGGFGLLPPTTLIPRLVAGTGVSTAQAMAAGYLASGPYHVGAAEYAMKLYIDIAEEYRQNPGGVETAGDLEQFAWDATARRIEAGETLGGFGHPLLRRDPRPTHIRRLICEMGYSSPILDIYDGVLRCLREKKGVPPNVDGICGAIMVDLGLLPQHGTGIFLLARSAAMLAHIVEEQTDMPYQTMKRFMLLPIAMPKVFNSNFKKWARQFNKLRDSATYNKLRDVMMRRSRRDASEREQANQAVVDLHRSRRNASAVNASTVSTANPNEYVDRFITTPPPPPEAQPGDELIPDMFLDDCSSPELLAGAAMFLSNCLQSLPAGADGQGGGSERTQALVNSALELVRQASEAVSDEAKKSDPPA